MANPEHLARLAQRVTRTRAKAWNQWRKKQPDIKPDLRAADLRKLDLSMIDLNGADLRRAKLRDADLSQSNLTGADLDGADLASSCLSGADLSNARLMDACLRDANLSGACLSAAYLVRADLGNADLTGSDLADADLEGVNLEGASLCSAYLHSANLSGVRLFGANLTEACLYGTNLSSANLDQSNFNRARLMDTILDDNDLRTVKGLEAAQHGGPSVIGVATIYRSQGMIPDVFLRGSGVADDFIAYMHALAANPVEFYSCFISYSSNDQEFAERLHADLQGKGVRCWFASHDMQAGKKVHEQIDQAIRVHERLLLVLSHDSMQSEWVKTEIAKARKREMRENRRVLFPIRLVSFDALKDWECFDADTGKDSAREIREYFIPDFSNWKDHDSYRNAFERLLRDLKAGRIEHAHSATVSSL